MFLPTKSAACNALGAFLPKSGRDYAAKRNYDTGPGEESTASKLSPWIRIRLLPEWEVLTTVLEQHSSSDASKFIDEVCWRTYWKGWLQLRPKVWLDYLEDRGKLLKDFNQHIGYQRAIAGRTGIECFDSWNRELIENNYLHNHARMWYASIWVHTLKLPWQLGADWFYRHLLDGDPASNTLSWRWVAGLHTLGKTYLARADNIRKYTNGRFHVEEDLATDPAVVQASPHPEPQALPELKPPPTGKRLGLLVTEEDLSIVDWLPELYPVAATSRYFPSESYQALDVCPKVIQFRHKALTSLLGEGILEDSAQLLQWAREQQLDDIITVEPTKGHWPEIIKILKHELSNDGIELFTVRHWWDEALFPHATKGFYRFKQAIPDVIEALGRRPKIIHE